MPCPPTSSSRKAGGTLVMAQWVVPPSPLNMILSTVPGADYEVGALVYDSLYRILPTGEIGPGLAQKTEISSDNLTWTITLPPAVKFHDGTDLDASAVKSNLDIRKTHPTFSLKSQMAPIKEVKILDSTRLQLVLTQPAASLRAVLASPGFGIQSPTAMAKYPDAAQYAQHAAGSGPFRLEGSPTDTQITLVRNDSYWGPNAYLDKIVDRIITDDSARVAALDARDIQFADVIPSTEIARLQKEGRVVPMITPNASAIDYLYINTAAAPFTDLRVR